MKDITLTFLLLRKNGKMLKEFVNDIKTPDVIARRKKHIIELKRKLAALKPSQYMLIKTIATELHRFEIMEVTRQFTKQSNIVNFVINDKIIKANVSEHRHYGSSASESDPKVIFDKVHGIHFVLSNDDTVVDDIVLFEGDEHEWFKAVFLELRSAKDAEEKLLQQQKEHEEKQRLLNRKENLLAKYYS